ncbi:MAG: host specificity factor TipJ family phage tail protein [Rhizomicrobium sp.]
MTARIAHIRNPLTPQIGLRSFEVEPGVVLTRAIADAQWHLAGATFLVRRDALDRVLDWNSAAFADVFVRRAEWDAEALDDGETRVLVTLPQGGGGGGGGSNIGAIVAQIGLMLIAYVLAGPAGLGASLATEIGTSAAVGAALVESSIMIGGMLLLSAVLPQPKPKAQGTASPTYDLGLQSNMARLGAAVPEWFGLYDVVPDLRSQPYINYNLNQEYVQELFCVGKGSYEVHALRIGMNVFARLTDGVLQSTDAYPEIEWQLAGSGEDVTLFPDNVVTSTEVSGIEILGDNEDGYGDGFTAWFAANPPGTKTLRITIDVALPAGLYHTTNDGNINRAEIDFEVWARPVDDYDRPTGDAFLVLDEKLVMATITPHRVSRLRVVPFARYQVRMKRTNSKAVTTSTGDTLSWLALRAQLPSQKSYEDCTMLAIEAQATRNLNGTSSDQINAVVERELITPVKVDGVWQWSDTPQPTRSIGAAAYYLLTSSNNAGLDPSRVDGDWLLQYESVWNGRGDTFDGGFDNQGSFWDMLNQVMNVGRAQALPGPLIGFVRDEPKTVYRCAFGPRQMVKDSFAINYVFFDQNNADAANVTYMDSVNWQTNTVFCALPGSTLDADTAPQVTGFGMVSRDQVFRTWMYNLAASCYRREFPTFDTEVDGRVCQRGDLVKISHVMPQWGAQADVVALEENDAGDILTLSEPWTLSTDSPVVSIATPDGYIAGPASVSILDDGATTHRAVVQLTESCTADQGNFAGEEPRAWGLFGDTVRGLQRERPKAMLGDNATTSVDALVVAMTPQSGQNATVACAVDDPRVYTADEGAVPPPADYPGDTTPEDLAIVNLLVREVPNPPAVATTDASASLCTVTVGGAPDAVSFDLQTRYRDGGSWGPIANYSSPVFQFRSGRGAIEVAVRGIGASCVGAWTVTEVDVEGFIEIINANFDFSARANAGNYSLLSAMWH